MFHVKHLHLDLLNVSRETLLNKEDLFAERSSGIQGPANRGPRTCPGLSVEDNESVSG